MGDAFAHTVLKARLQEVSEDAWSPEHHQQPCLGLERQWKDCSMPELTYSYLSAPCSGLRIELHTSPILELAWPSLLLTWL